jgi:hypothetical protein
MRLASSPARALLPALAALAALSGCSGGFGAAAAPSSSEAASAAAAAASSVAAAATSSPPEGAETDPDAPVATDPPRPASTDVAISYLYWDPAAGAVLGSGYVSPVIEDGGTCTLVLSRSGASVQATSTGVADASTSSCGELRLPGSRLRSGEWTAVLRYSSDTAEGESEPMTVAVP